jgi:hypothetical protein
MATSTRLSLSEYMKTSRQCVGDAWTAADKLAVPGTKIWVDLSKLFADLDQE